MAKRATPAETVNSMAPYGMRIAAEIYRPFGHAYQSPRDAPFPAGCPNFAGLPNEHECWYDDRDKTFHCWKCKQNGDYLTAIAAKWKCTPVAAAKRLCKMFPSSEYSHPVGCCQLPWFADRARGAMPKDGCPVALPYRAPRTEPGVLKRDKVRGYLASVHHMQRNLNTVQGIHAWYVGLFLDQTSSWCPRDKTVKLPFGERMQRIYKRIYSEVEAPWLLRGMSINEILAAIRQNQTVRLEVTSRKGDPRVDSCFSYRHNKGHLRSRLAITLHDGASQCLLDSFHRIGDVALRERLRNADRALVDLVHLCLESRQISRDCVTLLGAVLVLGLGRSGLPEAMQDAVRSLHVIARSGNTHEAVRAPQFEVKTDRRILTAKRRKKFFGRLPWSKQVIDRYKVTIARHRTTKQEYVVIPIEEWGNGYVGFVVDDLTGTIVPCDDFSQPLLFGESSLALHQGTGSPGRLAEDITIFADPRDVLSGATCGCAAVSSTHGMGVWSDQWSQGLAERECRKATLLFPKTAVGRRSAMRVALSLADAGIAPSVAEWPDDAPDNTTITSFLTGRESNGLAALLRSGRPVGFA